MPVIIREEKTIDGRKVVVKVYETGVYPVLTGKLRQQAEKLDAELSRRMREIAGEMEQSGLLKLKKKKNVIRLWYEVGKKLSFITDTSIVPAGDRKYVWRALYDHAGNLAPGAPSVRANERPMTSHFRYCYLLSQYPWQFVESAGNWTAWYEFFDSQIIRSDARIISWLGEKQKLVTSSKQNWLRALTRGIRNALKGTKTEDFKDDELRDRLEAIFRRVY